MIGAAPRGARLAYVVSGFPDLTESFIRREVEQVRALGVSLTVCSLRPRPRTVPDPALADHVAETVYAPWIGRRVLAAHAAFLARHPLRYLGALALVLGAALRQARHPDMPAKTLAVFPKTVYFARVLAGRGVTHVHAHFANHPTTAAMAIARLLAVPFSFTGHAWDIFVPKNQLLLAAKIAAARAVVTCTEYNRRVLEKFCTPADARKIAVCYHGVAVPQETAAAREPGLVLAVGSLAAKKGFADLLSACAVLAGRGVPFRCEIIGEGPERAALERGITQAGLVGRVALRGARPHAEVLARMARAAVFVLPSVRARDASMDGIPNVILEAFSLGTPVVSTRLSGIPEVVCDGETGTLVEPGDVQALAGAIAAVLADPAHHGARAARGRALVRERFDLERNVRAMVEWILGAGPRGQSSQGQPR